MIFLTGKVKGVFHRAGNCLHSECKLSWQNNLYIGANQREKYKKSQQPNVLRSTNSPLLAPSPHVIPHGMLLAGLHSMVLTFDDYESRGKRTWEYAVQTT